jgi:antitoxin ParD1/3/4
MSSIEKISIALPSEMVSQVREAVDKGEYASSSEVVRDALRSWSLNRRTQQEGIEELRRVWKQALENSHTGVSAEQVLGRLERRYRPGTLTPRRTR